VQVQNVLKYDTDGNLLSANLDVRNPRRGEEFEHMPPEKLLEDIAAKERKILGFLEEIKDSLLADKTKQRT
jgi:type I restriction enzyme M protein